MGMRIRGWWRCRGRVAGEGGNRGVADGGWRPDHDVAVVGASSRVACGGRRTWGCGYGDGGDADAGWQEKAATGVWQTAGGGSMAGNGGRTRGKGFVRLTRAGRRSTPRSNTRRPSWRYTPFPGSRVTVPLNIRHRPPSADTSLTSGPISLQSGPEPHHADYLRPRKPLIRAGTTSCRLPQAQYPYNPGRNDIMPTTSGPESP